MRSKKLQKLIKWGGVGLSATWCSMLVACGGGASAATPSEEASSGGEATLYEGPIASTDVAGGEALFSTFCDDCHPGGEEDVGPSLIADPHTPARLRQQVREGSGRMKPVPEKRLGPEELEALLAYLDSIGAVSK